ncbi:uncharacterized protein EKO05_0010395 [Ascochyta rabiei]|uniref:Uncharacterized protein n=1 Tax=Didymella rabiei TaxID=5454 RepID=A0A162W920_DIDRA|nr:uncharacterized protein EKO05_0010395 [Ascochyta rabiei]KZM18883.1 hypothetical protein ST47_g9971 [Ascochyta rabiei]KZM28562.1 hypothetical protein ST47_g294 [Ascochyta rabiei]UPX20153.1 hypothetical protein EKO05_0010395 [Ascochyta rabiei]
MPTTILDCFEGECPKYPGTYRTFTATASSEGTKLQPPPNVLVETALDYWLQCANKFLQEEQLKGTNSKLAQDYIASDEPTMAKLDVEEDVVRVSTLYITHPIQNAINARYQAPITIATEVRVSRFRYDLSFNIKQDTDQKQPIMVIEYKRVGMIDYADFDVAVEEKNKQRALSKLNAHGGQSVLMANANGFILCKQAAAYAKSTKCNFVALCDYDKLVLLEFESSDFARVTTIPRQHIRKALLGFCLKACEQAQLQRK